MPQTTTKASEIAFYVVAAMLVILLALVAINIYKTNSLSSNMRDACTCTGETTGMCKFTSSDDQFKLNKTMNYLILGITIIVLIIVVARNFLLG